MQSTSVPPGGIMLTHDLGVTLEVMRGNQQTGREAGIIFQVYLSWISKGTELIE